MQTFNIRGKSLRLSHIIVILLAVCFSLIGVKSLNAQANAGLTGTVTDATGATISGANVTITSAGTGEKNRTVTSSAGTYAVTGLVPGVYSITVEANGFKKEIQNSVNVEVSTNATVNVSLATGSSTETVEVTANAIALNTTQPQLGSTVDPAVVAALPNEVAGRGRQIDALQFLVPGVTGSTFSHRIGGGVDFEQEITYNGIPAPQPETEGYTTNFNPPYEMIKEFRVERSTFAAQFGLGQGALTYQMASGTNRYHGDLFEINRNSLFDSVGFFNGPNYNPSNVKDRPPTDHENNYGFTVAGPVTIPHLYNGRDRTFFHYSQEWYKQNNENTKAGTVPTALEKTGDFTDFVDSNNKLIPIFDPTTGKQFSYKGTPNRIDPARISHNSSILIPFIPNPDLPGLDTNKSFAPFVNPSIQHVFGFTIDQKINETQQFHYSEWRNSFSNYGFDYNPIVLAPNPLNSLRYFPARGTGFLGTYDNTLTPNLVMTAGFGWIGELNNQFNQSSYDFPAVQNGVIPPNIVFDGQHTLTSWGTGGSNLRSINRKLGIAIVNNYLWSKGRNTFNIGGEFRRTYQDDNEEQTAGGEFQFSQRTTSDPVVAGVSNANFGSDGSSFASFLLGTPDAANRSNSQELRLRNLDLSPYVQDDFKVSPKLTVNVGLRWDMQVPFTENNNLVVFFNPTTPNPAANGILGAATKFGSCTGCAGYTRASTHFGHFGPRLGFAYQISDKTVIQGGFSVAFLNGGAYEYGTNKVAVNYGNLLTGSFTRLSTGTNNSSFGSWDTTQLTNPQATPFSPGLGVGTKINDFNKNDGFAPYSEQWNINVQRRLPYDMFLQAAWVGNRVIHLPSNLNYINQLDPKYLTLGSKLGDAFTAGATSLDGFKVPYANFVNNFGGSATLGQALQPYPQYSQIMNNFEGSGTTYYESAQIEVEKRFTNGLNFLAGYTLSRLMDNTSSGFTSFANGALNKYNQRPEYTVSGSDEPNTFKASGTYELPIGPGKTYLNNKNVTGQVLGGWQVSFILDYEAGTATGAVENGTPFPQSNQLRPDRASGSLYTRGYGRVAKQFSGGPVARMWNPAGFSLTPSQYVFGNSFRNYAALRNPAFYNEDLNARKHFYFGERFTGILAIDYFNAFNRTQFQNPDNNLNDATYGQVISKTAQTNGPINRQGQISFRLEF